MKNLYYRHVRAGRRAKDARYCGVIAVAVAAGVSFNDAYDELAYIGRKHRNGTWGWQIKIALERFGFVVEDVTKRYPEARTTITAERTLPNRRGVTFILMQPTHFAAVRYGKLHDWSQGRRTRVEHIWRVSRAAA